MDEQAKNLTRGVRERFIEFVKSKGTLAEVARNAGCSPQVLRNSVVDGKNPHLNTIFHVKLGYKEEFDDLYIFTGKRSDVTSEAPTAPVSADEHDEPNHETTTEWYKERIRLLEEMIEEYKRDKAFLQEIIRRNTVKEV